MVIIWLGLALSFLFVELISPGLIFFFSFFCGSLAAAVVCAVPYDLTIQLVSFALMSIFGFWALTYWLKRHHQRYQKYAHETNVYRLIGKTAVVFKAIEPHSFGVVKVQGQLWSARCLHETFIKHNSLVEIVNSKGCHLIVKAINHKE